MDAASLREKAALCLRVSRGLSWNNPARLQLLELAERLERQAKELELQNHPAEKVARRRPYLRAFRLTSPILLRLARHRWRFGVLPQL
jgi:hypothetical protein